MRFYFLLTSILFMAFAHKPKPTKENATVTLNITNIRSTTGDFVLGFYKDNASFSKRQPFMRKQISKDNLKNGVVTFDMTLPEGTYGIALLDDENKNGKMDYGFLLPKEGFGFSEYYHRGLTSPSFEDFDFEVKSSSRKTVLIKVKYM